MKKIALFLAASLCLTACQNTPPATAVENDGGIQTLEDSSVVVSTDSSNLTDFQLDQSSSDMMNEQAADIANEAAETTQESEPQRTFEYMNLEDQQDVYVLRDTDTGCEFIQAQYSNGGLALVERPDGKGHQRGCGTGRDFKITKK